MAKAKKKKQKGYVPARSEQFTKSAQSKKAGKSRASAVTAALLFVALIAISAIVYSVVRNTVRAKPFYSLENCTKVLLHRSEDTVELGADSKEAEKIVQIINKNLPKSDYTFFPVSEQGELDTAVSDAKYIELVFKEPQDKNIELSDTKSMDREFTSLVFMLDSSYSGMIVLKDDGKLQPGTYGKFDVPDTLIESFNNIFGEMKTSSEKVSSAAGETSAENK